ncbi:MAG: ABC transporter permease [Anaerolineae bacterium]|nr:ABC transporter permease [Anaerolineae bacterium]
MQSQWAIAWRRFKRNKAAMVSAVIVLFYFVIAIIGPSIAPHNPVKDNSGKNDLPPVWIAKGPNGKANDPNFIFGTDTVGRDIFSKMIYGTRTAIAVGIIPTVVVLLIGGLIGYIAGLSGGWIDNTLMRVTDIFYAIPIELMLILTMITLGDTVLGKTLSGVPLFLFGIAIVSWSGVARLLRGQALALRGREFVEAARSMARQLVHHQQAYFAQHHGRHFWCGRRFAIPRQIIAEAILGYIGLGLKPALTPNAVFITSWGRMFLEAYANVSGNPWYLLIVAIVVSILVIAFTFLGDGLRDALDPRQK